MSSENIVVSILVTTVFRWTTLYNEFNIIIATCQQAGLPKNNFEKLIRKKKERNRGDTQSPKEFRVLKNLTVKNQTVRKFKSNLRFLSKINPFQIGVTRGTKRVWLDYNTDFYFNTPKCIKIKITNSPHWGMENIPFYNPPWGMQAQEALVVRGAA